MNKEIVTICIVASERSSDKKLSYKSFLRLAELTPTDIPIIKKILTLSHEFGDKKTEEIFTKKFSDLNPDDNGLKYRLAGFYVNTKQYEKANKIYEDLIKKGDISDYVLKSYAYSKQLQHPPKQESIKIESYSPKPLSGFQIAEKNFYEALDAKNYQNALIYLDKMLKKQPRNVKLLKHRVDIAVIQEDYKRAILFFERIQKLKTFLTKDYEFLAFLYSKTGDDKKALSLIESRIQEIGNNPDLINLALQYSMAQKDWDKSIFYTNILLSKTPNSELYLKNLGDFYSIKKDFLNAAKAYENLIKVYPKPSYQLELANLYMASQEFEKAQNVLEPIYNNNNTPEITQAFLNSLLAQQKTRQAYWVIKSNGLEDTKEGYMVTGDMLMLAKDYAQASDNYFAALQFDNTDAVLNNKLADTYRALGYKTSADSIYKGVLEKYPSNLEAKLGTGSIQIDKKNYKKARKIFNEILKDKPDYIPAKIATAHSYIANDEKLNALETLFPLPQNDEVKLIKAQTYYDMNMWSNAKSALKGSATKDAEALRYKIKRDDAITITPTYSFLFQQLAENFKLDYHKFGINVAKNTDNNTKAFMEYNVYVYSSGGGNQQNNVVNEFKLGAQSRPIEEFEYRADIGVKAFEFGGAMINTDSWIKRYFNDKYNLKLGFFRNNIEQSYIAAVGGLIDGIFTGRAADNKLYLEGQANLPHQFYMYAKGSYGLITAQNLDNNQYFEGLLGAGRLIYNNPNNKWINIFSADVVTYNSSYQYNLLKIYSSTGQLFGGYFSPGYFNATTLNLKLEGNIKKWKLKYGIKGFGGIQNAIAVDQTTPTWGVSPYISYDINDNVSINMAYNHYTFADIQRDLFMINAVIRGFKNGKKSNKN